MNKKYLGILLLLVLGLALAGGVFLVQRENRLRSRADVEAITPVGLSKNAGGDWETSNTTVQLELRSPLGPPAP